MHITNFGFPISGITDFRDYGFLDMTDLYISRYLDMRYDYMRNPYIANDV